jgi:hypothetical protein
MHEVRSRVMCHLPVNDRQEDRAFRKVLLYLQGLRDQGVGVTGFAISTPRPAVFQGWWWSHDRQKCAHDDLVLCFVDYQLALDDPALSEQVEHLKRTIRKWYRLHRSLQEEVWVVAYQVIRQD